MLPAIFGILFAYCAIANWTILIRSWLTPERQSLVLPLLGPILGIAFLLTVPLEGASRWWWLAPLIEPSWIACGGFFITRSWFASANEAERDEPR